MNQVKIVSCALDVSQVGEGMEKKEWLVFRGVLSPDCLDQIKIPDYQRSVLVGSNQKRLMKALSNGVVPDVVLGMRGSKYTTEDEDGSQVYILTSHVYVIDGLQRLSAAIKIMEQNPTSLPRLGAMIYVDSSESWERKMFEDLNQNRVKVSPNVLLLNARHTNPFVETMHNLTLPGSGFVLANKVQWCQLMKREHIITALNFFRVTGKIHSRFGTGGGTVAVRDMTSLDSGMSKLMEVVGRNIVRENVKTFFDLIDEAFNLGQVHYTGRCPYVKGTFLCSIAGLLAEHDCFWDGKRLVVDKATRRKIATFPINDPNVSTLAGGNHTAEGILRGLLLEHINSGRRRNRLGGPASVPPEGEDIDSSSAE